MHHFKCVFTIVNDGGEKLPLTRSLPIILVVESKYNYMEIVCCGDFLERQSCDDDSDNNEDESEIFITMQRQDSVFFELTQRSKLNHENGSTQGHYKYPIV